MARSTAEVTEAQRALEHLSLEELTELLEARGGGGIHIDFSGKTKARKLYRQVRPFRVSRGQDVNLRPPG